MKSIKILIFSLLIVFGQNIFAAHPAKKQLLSPQKTLEVLEGIKQYAIVFGEGKKEIHTFIDPYCSVSKRYLKFVFQKQNVMFKKYKMYFYLYELPRKKSLLMIQNIIDSEYPNTMLKSSMVNEDELILEEIDEEDVDTIIEQISIAAEKIGVFKRPYIIINGKVK